MSRFFRLQIGVMILMSFLAQIAFWNEKATLLFLSIGTVTLFLRQWVWHRVFLRGPQVSAKSTEVAEFVFLGTKLPHDKEHEEAQNLLRYWVSTYGGWRFVLSSVLLLSGFAFVLPHFEIPLTFTTFFLIATNLLILAIVYYEHFLLVYSGAIFIFWINFSKLAHPKLALIAFLFILFSNFILYSWSRPQSGSKNISFLLPATSYALVFVATFWLFDKIIPDRKPTLTQKSFVQKIARSAAQRMPMKIENLPQSMPEKRALELAQRMSDADRQEILKEAGIETGDTPRSDASVSAKNNLSEAERQEFMKLAKDLSRRPTQNQSQNQNEGQSESEGQGQNQIQNQDQGFGEGQLKELLKSPTENKKLEAQKIQKKRQDLEKKFELQIQMFTKFILFLLGICGIFMASELLRRWFKKTKPDEIEDEQKTRLDKERLVKEYRKLIQRGLAAEEEIIKTYNIFLELMDGREMGKPLHWPTTEYTSKLKRDFPDLHSELDFLNEVFCDTLFAKKNPSDRLKKFRSSFQTVANRQIGVANRAS